MSCTYHHLPDLAIRQYEVSEHGDRENSRRDRENGLLESSLMALLAPLHASSNVASLQSLQWLARVRAAECVRALPSFRLHLFELINKVSTSEEH